MLLGADTEPLAGTFGDMCGSLQRHISNVSASGSELSLASTTHDDHDAADFHESADRGTSHVGKCGVMSRPIQASDRPIQAKVTAGIFIQKFSNF